MHRCEKDISGPVQRDRRRGSAIVVLSHCRCVGLGSFRHCRKVLMGGRCGPYLDERSVNDSLIDRLKLRWINTARHPLIHFEGQTNSVTIPPPSPSLASLNLATSDSIPRSMGPLNPGVLLWLEYWHLQPAMDGYCSADPPSCHFTDRYDCLAERRPERYEQAGNRSMPARLMLKVHVSDGVGLRSPCTYGHDRGLAFALPPSWRAPTQGQQVISLARRKGRMLIRHMAPA